MIKINMKRPKKESGEDKCVPACDPEPYPVVNFWDAPKQLLSIPEKGKLVLEYEVVGKSYRDSTRDGKQSEDCSIELRVMSVSHDGKKTATNLDKEGRDSIDAQITKHMSKKSSKSEGDDGEEEADTESSDDYEEEETEE